MAELREKILQILREHPTVVVCTSGGDGTPRGRYMMVGSSDTLELTSATFTNSRKVAELRANPRAHIVAGFNPADPNGPWVNMETRGEVFTDIETRRACWVDGLEHYFDGPEDENYCVVRFVPYRVEYWNMGNLQPEVLELPESR